MELPWGLIIFLIFIILLILAWGITMTVLYFKGPKLLFPCGIEASQRYRILTSDIIGIPTNLNNELIASLFVSEPYISFEYVGHDLPLANVSPSLNKLLYIRRCMGEGMVELQYGDAIVVVPIYREQPQITIQ